jgi:type IV secretory pathway ATPase VirB11/archaellum biosynthesis ATPase
VVTAVESRSIDRHVADVESIGPDYAEMMARYLGPAVIAAIVDDDVTEVYVNPQDSRVRVDTHSAGKRETGYRIAPERLEMFLNAAASAQGVEIGPSNPQIQTELPATVFGGARLQGFLPPHPAGDAVQRLSHRRPDVAGPVCAGALTVGRSRR